MQMKQTGSLRRSAQAGFTLIELIVVIVILGILAATALPKFADMSSDARGAKMKGAQGAVSSAAAISRAKWLAAGSTGTSVTLDSGAIETTKGYPKVDTIATAAGLDPADFTVTPAGDVLSATITDKTKTTDCGFTYTVASGSVSNLKVTGC